MKAMTKPMGQSKAAFTAFTLVELLVVISIIAILAALLLPVLAGAKSKAHKIDCQSRQKQWAFAFIDYTLDNDGLIPREGSEPYGEVVLNNWSQIAGRSLGDGTRDTDDIWYNALPKGLGLRPASHYSSPSQRLGFYERRQLIHCPSAEFPKDALRLNYQFALFSLAMNSHLIRAGEGPTVRFETIEQYHPDRFVLFLDNLLDGEPLVDPHQDTSQLGQPSAYADRFSPRHGKGGNLAFADGHVSWFPGHKVVETNPQSPLRGGPIVPPIDIIWERPYLSH